MKREGKKEKSINSMNTLFQLDHAIELLVVGGVHVFVWGVFFFSSLVGRMTSSIHIHITFVIRIRLGFLYCI